jgi:hypothetical protein
MPTPIIGLIGSALIGGVTSLASGAMAADASKKATKAQTTAADKNIAYAKEQNATNTANLAPWMEAGKAALERINTGIANGSFDISKYGMDDLIKDPGYQFRLDAGIKALEGSAASRGKLLSGDQQTGLIDYAEKSASQEFGNAFARTQAERDATFNRDLALSGNGQNAAGAIVGANQNLTSTVTGQETAKGTAAATGAINVANAWTGALSGVAQSAQTGIENYFTIPKPANLNAGAGAVAKAVY